MKRIAVFASGSGTNFQAIIDQQANFDAYEIVLLVCDKPEAKAIERAQKNNIPVFSFVPKDFESKQAFEKSILQELQRYGVDFIVLAGYMRLIGTTLLSSFEGRIINIHPSLLPAFPGKDAIGQAFEKKVRVSGVTIHYVDEGMDTGPIIAQAPVQIEEHDTYETLQQKIQRVEHELYPSTLVKLLCDEKITN
ncbi:phosphoribosylglycinamide formyltransferase [Bacillus solimangrovi]|uniref:Phosphoribosylglycinamide formyltransferase n=1 Tax=Bacillus solimangrovi TaxID=1305675 RepID=A0A1E5LH47_9BACI|nr:phosphoribosylglycinamide formyltransferase [Bacillus solimangrovi]OEH93398.1 phosphoribosylglycinamide formyltransferase [Bacillus solimangrovi]